MRISKYEYFRKKCISTIAEHYYWCLFSSQPFVIQSSSSKFKMSRNFTITKNGPVVPKGVNEKSFVSVKIGAGETHKFKDSNVAKMTAGKIRFRNEEEKSFTADNSEYAEKNDIVEITGSVIGHNEHKEDHASCRVFTSAKASASKTK